LRGYPQNATWVFHSAATSEIHLNSLAEKISSMSEGLLFSLEKISSMSEGLLFSLISMAQEISIVVEWRKKR